MSRVLLSRVMGVIAGLAIVLSSAPAWAQTGGIEGKCTSEKGEPLAGYLIQIHQTDISRTFKPVKTNKKGEYIHIGLPIGKYKVTLLTPEGANIFTLEAAVAKSGEPTTVDFDMAKETKLADDARKKKIEEDPELKRRMEEHAKDAKQLTGLKELFEQGSALMEQKRYAEAVPMFEQALPLAKTTNIPVVLGRLADAYHKSRMYDKAVETYQKVIALVPADASFHNNLGNIYADTGKTTEAAAEFQKAAELDPARAAVYHYNFGVVMYNSGNMDVAIGSFQKSVAVDPKNAEAQFMLGRALMGKLDLDPKTGKIIPAPGTVEALQAYLKLEPQGKHAAEVQTMIDTVQGGVETTYKKEKKKSKS